jgi:hypothetical protein
MADHDTQTSLLAQVRDDIAWVQWQCNGARNIF